MPAPLIRGLLHEGMLLIARASAEIAEIIMTGYEGDDRCRVGFPMSGGLMPARKLSGSRRFFEVQTSGLNRSCRQMNRSVPLETSMKFPIP